MGYKTTPSSRDKHLNKHMKLTDQSSVSFWSIVHHSTLTFDVLIVSPDRVDAVQAIIGVHGASRETARGGRLRGGSVRGGGVPAGIWQGMRGGGGGLVRGIGGGHGQGLGPGGLRDHHNHHGADRLQKASGPHRAAPNRVRVKPQPKLNAPEFRTARSSGPTSTS